MIRRKRILFVSESITLAQVVRLATLARALDRDRYQVHFAASDFPGHVDIPFQRWPLWGLSAARAQARLAAGKRIYSGRVLRRYLASDLAVIDRVRPDLIIGDLRWSLAVSAVVRKVPLASLINAYWSRFALRDGFPLPDHPAVRWLGEKLAAKYFPRALPWVFRHFARPLNRLRERAGLAPVGDLLDVLNFGDFVLYPDPPELVAVRPLPERHRFLGPVPWSAPGALPPAWGEAALPVYLTMGSSGDGRALPTLLRALARRPVDVLVATAGRAASLATPVRTATFVDGTAACARARLVIHNGGSSTGYQALLAGTPVLGIPSNLDQHLASRCIDAQGAGLSLRSGSLDADDVVRAVDHLLHDDGFRSQAQRLQGLLRAHDASENFRQFVAQVV